jgi:hypothetical protein
MASYDPCPQDALEELDHIPAGCQIFISYDDFNAPFIAPGDSVIVDPMLSPVDPVSHSLYLLRDPDNPPDIYHVRRRQTPQGELCFFGVISCPDGDIGPFTIEQMRGMICGRVVAVLCLNERDRANHRSAGMPA